MKKRIYLILLLLPLVSCNDMFKNFLNEEPETLVTNTNFWKTEKDVESAVYELHVMFRSWGGYVETLTLPGQGPPVRLSRFDLEKHLRQRITEGYGHNEGSKLAWGIPSDRDVQFHFRQHSSGRKYLKNALITTKDRR